MHIYFENSNINLIPFGVSLILGLIYILWRRKYRKSYLIFFTVFSFYLLFVIRVTLFPIPLYSEPIQFENFYSPHNLNLIPFNFGECHILRYCIFGSIANIYLTIPVGFGIQFLRALNKKERLWLILIIGFSIEILQLLISLGLSFPYRVIDINDVIFNALGVFIGLLFFKLFVWIYLALCKKWAGLAKGWFSYFYEVAILASKIRKDE